jgi:hypothetical protein
MPYRHAHWWLLALFPLAGLAFWRGYLSQFSTASMEFHAHGVAATLWLVLLAAQSWTINTGARSLHRSVGLSSLALFPLFMAGGAAIFIGMAERFVAREGPFYEMYAARLAWLDVVAVSAVAWFFYEAMRHRRKVHAHAGYLLATAVFLLPPILGRLAPILPPLTPSGPEEFWKLGVGFQLANGVVAALAFAIGLRRGKHGRPFHLAGVLTLLGAVLYQTVGGTAAWEALFARAADIPSLPFALFAGAAAVAVAYAGWIAGGQAGPTPKVSPAPETA